MNGMDRWTDLVSGGRSSEDKVFGKIGSAKLLWIAGEQRLRGGRRRENRNGLEDSKEHSDQECCRQRHEEALDFRLHTCKLP